MQMRNTTTDTPVTPRPSQQPWDTPSQTAYLHIWNAALHLLQDGSEEQQEAMLDLFEDLPADELPAADLAHIALEAVFNDQDQWERLLDIVESYADRIPVGIVVAALHDAQTELTEQQAWVLEELGQVAARLGEATPVTALLALFDDERVWVPLAAFVGLELATLDESAVLRIEALFTDREHQVVISAMELLEANGELGM